MDVRAPGHAESADVLAELIDLRLRHGGSITQAMKEKLPFALWSDMQLTIMGWILSGGDSQERCARALRSAVILRIYHRAIRSKCLLASYL